jgi:hypothetical protein
MMDMVKHWMSIYCNQDYPGEVSKASALPYKKDTQYLKRPDEIREAFAVYTSNPTHHLGMELTLKYLTVLIIICAAIGYCFVRFIDEMIFLTLRHGRTSWMTELRCAIIAGSLITLQVLSLLVILYVAVRISRKEGRILKTGDLEDVSGHIVLRRVIMMWKGKRLTLESC